MGQSAVGGLAAMCQNKNCSLYKYQSCLKARGHSRGGYVFGMLNLARCGAHVDKAGHMIAFYATNDEVVYIDCQNNKTPIFSDLQSVFRFPTGKKGEKIIP